MNTPPDVTRPPTADQWVFVIVQHPEANAQITGQHDTVTEEAFIPTYYRREDAQQGLLHLTLPKSARYEIHAFIFEDLCAEARNGGFLVYMVDADGGIRHKITP